MVGPRLVVEVAVSGLVAVSCHSKVTKMKDNCQCNVTYA